MTTKDVETTVEKVIKWVPTATAYGTLSEPARAILVRRGFELSDARSLVRLVLPSIAQNSVLVLARPPHEVETAVDVARYWGFSPRSEVVVRHANVFDVAMVATRGRVVPRDKSIRLLDVAFVDGSSLHAWIEGLVDGPYVEIFAHAREGWHTFGADFCGFTPRTVGETKSSDVASSVDIPKVHKDFLRNIHGDPAIRAKLIKLAYEDGVLRKSDDLKDPWAALVAAVPTLTTGVSMRWFEGAMRKIGLFPTLDPKGDVRAIAHVPALEKKNDLRVQARIDPNGEMVITGEPIEDPDPFAIDDPDAPPETQDPPRDPEPTEVDAKRAMMIRSAEIQGLIPPGLTPEEAWIKLQYAAPEGWFKRWVNVPTPAPSAPTTATTTVKGPCAACERGEPITDENAYKHACDGLGPDKRTERSTEKTSWNGPGRPPGRVGRCSKCGSTAHNARTCPVANLSPEEQKKKRSEDQKPAETSEKRSGTNGASTDAWAKCIAQAETMPDEHAAEDDAALLRAFGGGT